MEKFKVLAIMGKSASGKSHLEKMITNKFKDMNRIISTTTRPKRDYETDGVEYHFISTDDFANKIMNMDMIEAVDFNDWFYGTDISALKEGVINVGVYNPTGISIMLEDPRIDLRIIYVFADDKIRLLRSLNREANPDCKEIIRRFTADEISFGDTSESMADIKNSDVHAITIFNNDNFILEELFDDERFLDFILGKVY